MSKEKLYDEEYEDYEDEENGHIENTDDGQNLAI